MKSIHPLLLLLAFTFLTDCKAKKNTAPAPSSQDPVELANPPEKIKLNPDEAVLTFEVLERMGTQALVQYLRTEKQGFGFSAYLSKGDTFKITSLPEHIDLNEGDKDTFVLEEIKNTDNHGLQFRFIKDAN